MEDTVPLAPLHHCPFCGGAVDPLQALGPEGGCPEADCRRRSRLRALADDEERRGRRQAAAIDEMRRRGLDPDRERWQVVPRNDAGEVPLPAATVRSFRAHLERVVAGAAGGGRPRRRPTPPHPTPLPAATRALLAEGCRACRGWCCRRGGDHAFLDAASLARVGAEHPEWSPDDLEAAYLGHLEATHLEGGCLFQGPDGCRLPTSLRSDRCNEWWCPDLESLLPNDDGTGPESLLRFVAIATERDG